MDGRTVLVDYERARVMDGWIPRRLGMCFIHKAYQAYITSNTAIFNTIQVVALEARKSQVNCASEREIAPSSGPCM